MTLLTKLCELSVISERILSELYSESQDVSQSQRQKISEDVNSDLSRWRQNLPAQINYFSQSDEFLLLPQSFCLMYASLLTWYTNEHSANNLSGLCQVC